jgi:very-short-patch-repair endonuclease
VKNMDSITIRSRQLRKKQTPAETIVWKAVRNRRLGFKIVRQKPVLLDYFNKKVAFIADFYCDEAKLVIEIDGSVHSKKSDYDSLRTLLMQQKGLRLIRFTNDDVIGDINGVLRQIKNNLILPIICLSTNGEGGQRPGEANSDRGEVKIS